MLMSDCIICNGTNSKNDLDEYEIGLFIEYIQHIYEYYVKDLRVPFQLKFIAYNYNSIKLRPGMRYNDDVGVVYGTNSKYMIDYDVCKCLAILLYLKKDDSILYNILAGSQKFNKEKIKLTIFDQFNEDQLESIVAILKSPYYITLYLLNLYTLDNKLYININYEDMFFEKCGFRKLRNSYTRILKRAFRYDPINEYCKNLTNIQKRILYYNSDGCIDIIDTLLNTVEKIHVYNNIIPCDDSFSIALDVCEKMERSTNMDKYRNIHFDTIPEIAVIILRLLIFGGESQYLLDRSLHIEYGNDILINQFIKNNILLLNGYLENYRNVCKGYIRFNPRSREYIDYFSRELFSDIIYKMAKDCMYNNYDSTMSKELNAADININTLSSLRSAILEEVQTITNMGSRHEYVIDNYLLKPLSEEIKIQKSFKKIIPENLNRKIIKLKENAERKEKERSEAEKLELLEKETIRIQKEQERLRKEEERKRKLEIQESRKKIELGQLISYIEKFVELNWSSKYKVVSLSSYLESLNISKGKWDNNIKEKEDQIDSELYAKYKECVKKITQAQAQIYASNMNVIDHINDIFSNNKPCNEYDFVLKFGSNKELDDIVKWGQSYSNWRDKRTEIKSKKFIKSLQSKIDSPSINIDNVMREKLIIGGGDVDPKVRKYSIKYLEDHNMPKKYYFYKETVRRILNGSIKMK